MQCKGKHILWSHAVDLYKSSAHCGLSLVPKLKYEHIHLSSFSKMRVDLLLRYVMQVHMCIVLSLLQKFLFTMYTYRVHVCA